MLSISQAYQYFTAGHLQGHVDNTHCWLAATFGYGYEKLLDTHARTHTKNTHKQVCRRLP